MIHIGGAANRSPTRFLPRSQAEPSETGVEVYECLLWEGGHGVPVQSQQRQVGDAHEGLPRKNSEQVEAQVQHLKNKKKEKIV